MSPAIRVLQGDITGYTGDAIVNAANNRLILGAGVAGAIRRVGGPAIQRACDRHGPIRVGQAAITEAGNLPVRWVIHAAAMGDEPVSERSIRTSAQASLTLAVRHGVKRIAFPVLGSGIGGFDFRAAAEILRDVVLQFADATALEEVAFYGFTTADARVLEDVMHASGA